MKIAVLGTGHVGATLGRRWATLGYTIVFGSREPQGEHAAELGREAEPSASVASVREAAADAEVILLAVPWMAAQQTLADAGPLDGKLLIDCINPVNAEFNGLDIGHTTSAAEQIARWAPGAKVVKAFNTASVATMADPHYEGGPATLFYCGDDDEAKATVAQLAAELEFDPVDAGPLKNARYLEPLAWLYIHLAVMGGWGSNCAIKMMKR